MDAQLKNLERELLGDQLGQFDQQQVKALKQHNIDDLDREKEQILLAQVSEKSQDMNLEEDDINSKSKDRYFLLKSINHDNIAISISNCTWATQPHNQSKLNEAFYNSDQVHLIFSVNRSGTFQGYALMRSPIQHKNRTQSWTGGTQTGGDFDLEWQYVVDLPFNQTEHLKNPWNEGKPVKIGRDGQELPPSVGRKLVDMIDDLAQRLGVQKQVATKIFTHDKQRRPQFNQNQLYNQGLQNGGYNRNNQGQQAGFGNNKSMGYNSQYGGNYIYNSDGAQIYNPYINQTMDTYGQNSQQQYNRSQQQTSQLQNTSYSGQQNNSSVLLNNQTISNSNGQQMGNLQINNQLLNNQQQLVNNLLLQNPLQIQQLLNSVQLQNPLQLQQQLALTLQLQQQQQQQLQPAQIKQHQLMQNSNKRSSESSVQNSRGKTIPNEQSVYDNNQQIKGENENFNQINNDQSNVKSEQKRSFISDSDDVSSVSSMFENGHRMSYVTYLESFTKLQSKTKYLNVQNQGQSYLQNLLQATQQQVQPSMQTQSKQQNNYQAEAQTTEQYGYLGGGAEQSNQVGSKRIRETYSQIQEKDTQNRQAKRSNNREQKMYTEEEQVSAVSQFENVLQFKQIEVS